MTKNRSRKNNYIENFMNIVIVSFLALAQLAIIFKTNFDTGPDESMRYLLSDYLYRNNFILPDGRDAAIRSEI